MPDHHSGLSTAAITGALWYSAAGLLSHTASIGLTIIIARHVGPTNYGLVAIAIAFIAILQSFLEQTFSDTIVRLPRLQKDYCNLVFWLELGLGVLLLSAVVVLAPVVALIVHQPQVTLLLQALAPLTLLTALTAVPAALLERDLNYRALFLRSVLGVVGGGLVGMVMAIADYGPWSLVAQQLARWTIQVAVLWIASDWRPHFKLSLTDFKEVWSYGIRMCGLQLVDFLRPQGSRLVIVTILGSSSLAMYDIAARFCLFLEIILIHPLGVLFPTISKIKDSRPVVQLFNVTVMRTAAIITVPACVGLACVAPLLIPMLLGEAWAGAIGVMQILCVATFFNMFTAIYSPMLRALGMPGWQFLVSAVTTTATLLLLSVLAPLGLIFAATALAITAGLGWLVQLFVVRHVMYSEIINQHVVIVPAIVGAALMAFAVLIYHNFVKTVMGEPLLLATEIIAGIVVYVGLAFMLQRSFVLTLVAHVRDVVKCTHRKTGSAEA